MEDRSLRTEFRRALDAVAPAAPWLGAAIREELHKRRHESWVERARRGPAQTRIAVAGLTMAVVAVLVAAAFLLAQLYAPVQAPIPAARSNLPSTPTLTATEQAQLAQLESRPLTFPAMPANGQCVDGPHPTITPYRDGTIPSVWGIGPVFVEGGNATLSSQNAYFDVTFYTDPTVSGVVLVRGQQLDGRFKVVYVGAYAAGPVVGADAIAGQVMDQHAEAALPADRSPTNSNAAPGWGIWKIRQGIDQRFIGCTGIQFDTAAGSEVFVVYDPGATGAKSTP